MTFLFTLSVLELVFKSIILHCTIKVVYLDIERVFGPEFGLAFQLFFCWFVICGQDFLNNYW
jgi:hypothetical protein